MSLTLANTDQQFVIERANDWFFNDPHNLLFQYTGGPGTGKSVTLNLIVDSLGIDRDKVAPAAYTGAAAIVLRTKGFYNARTEHSWLFTPTDVNKYDAAGNIIMDPYFNVPIQGLGFKSKALADGVQLMLIDEAPMTPLYIRKEIESRGIRTIACGDSRQLPPVEEEQGYLIDGSIYELHQIMRQQEDNPIIWLSERAYAGLPIHEGLYKGTSGSVLVINEDELTNNMISWSDIVVCGTNKTRDAMNKRVREEILDIRSPLPQFGERLVCRKNDWNKEVDGISLANGLVGRVTSHSDASCFDGKTFTIDFCPLIMDRGFIGLRCNYDYLLADHTQRQMIKNNKYYEGARMEFAYCITTYVSQGSEYANGIYIKEYLSKEINNRLDFTAITRFKNQCIIVLPKRKFF